MIKCRIPDCGDFATRAFFNEEHGRCLPLCDSHEDIVDYFKSKGLGVDLCEVNEDVINFCITQGIMNE